MTNRTLLNVAALLFAVLGGSFFGLASCGGYGWHKSAYLAVLALSTAVALWFPISASHPFAARAGLVVTIGIGYFVSEATAAAFYPSAPGSWSEFFAAFKSSLFHGPC
jgi:hypothetical protein